MGEPMTQFGYSKLSNELNELKTEIRPEIVKEIEAALEHGDLKENAEYHAAKEKQRLTDERMIELSALLAEAQIIDPETLPHERISFGSTITLCDLDSDSEVCYTIVGGFESIPEKGLISFNSPLAKQLLGKEEGDEVSVKLPSGKREYEIINVCYKAITFE